MLTYCPAMIDREGPVYVYVQIADEIRARISSGALKAGDTAPSLSDITEQWGVASATARRAIRQLQDEGLVHSMRGRGTFVGPPGTETADVPTYRRMANEIIERVRAGELVPDRVIPSETTLMQEYGVAKMTVRQAVALLRDRGWVVTVPNRGTFVASPDKWPES